MQESLGYLKKHNLLHWSPPENFLHLCPLHKKARGQCHLQTSDPRERPAPDTDMSWHQGFNTASHSLNILYLWTAVALLGTHIVQFYKFLCHCWHTLWKQICIVKVWFTLVSMLFCGQALFNYNMTNATLSSNHHTCIYFLGLENPDIVQEDVVGWYYWNKLLI